MLLNLLLNIEDPVPNHILSLLLDLVRHLDCHLQGITMGPPLKHFIRDRNVDLLLLLLKLLCNLVIWPLEKALDLTR